MEVFKPANWMVEAYKEWYYKWSPLTAEEAKKIYPVWHDNIPEHIDYEALRREL